MELLTCYFESHLWIRRKLSMDLTYIMRSWIVGKKEKQAEWVENNLNSLTFPIFLHYTYIFHYLIFKNCICKSSMFILLQYAQTLLFILRTIEIIIVNSLISSFLPDTFTYFTFITLKVVPSSIFYIQVKVKVSGIKCFT